jgi:hypothetical protein
MVAERKPAQGAQYGVGVTGDTTIKPPRAWKPPVPFVGVDANGQRGHSALHWTPKGIPVPE